MNEMYDKKEESIKRANDVYNQLVNESKDITDSQINQIDNFNTSETNRINQSVENNINELSNANSKLENSYQNELAGAQNDYNRTISLPIGETSRIVAQNALNNRQYSAQTSREQAYQEYLNQSNLAKISGDATIAQVALEALKEKLNLNSAMNQYNNQLELQRISNDRALDNNYWGLQQNYNNAVNDANALSEKQRQFNETMAYQKAQDKIENDLKEKEYQLDLKNAKKSASSGSRYSYSSKSGNSSGVQLTDTNKKETTNNNNTTTNTSKNVSGSSKYYSNYTPLGLSSDGAKAFKTLSSISDKNGYVTLSVIQQTIKKLPKDQQGIILSAFKEGSTKPSAKKSWTDYFKWW